MYGFQGLLSNSLIFCLSSFDTVLSSNNLGKNPSLYSLYTLYNPLRVSCFLPMLCLSRLTKSGDFGLFLLGWFDNHSLMYGIDWINGICLLPVLPLTKTSAYCLPLSTVLNTTSFIFKFSISCGLADKSLAIVW